MSFLVNCNSWTNERDLFCQNSLFVASEWADNDVDVDGDCWQAWERKLLDFYHGKLSTLLDPPHDDGKLAFLKASRAFDSKILFFVDKNRSKQKTVKQIRQIVFVISNRSFCVDVGISSFIRDWNITNWTWALTHSSDFGSSEAIRKCQTFTPPAIERGRQSLFNI